MARTRETRAHGPYRHGNRWRILVVGVGGEQVAQSFETEAEAQSVVDALKSTLTTEAKTVQQAIDEYEVERTRAKKPAASVATTVARITSLVRPVLARQLSALTPARCLALYDVARGKYAVDTHRNALSEAKTWGSWLVKRRLAKRNPWAEVQGEGERRKGEKPQLRVDEARCWLNVALRKADEGELGAVAAMIALLCGLRSKEIVNLQARDIDDDGRVICIDKTKSKKGRRRLLVPDVLRPYVLEAKRLKLPEAYLLGYHDRGWPTDWVVRLCKLAGVPRVTGHGMRGLHSTLAIDAGVSGAAVAASMGHASVAITMAHYAEKGSDQRAATARTAKALVIPG